MRMKRMTAYRQLFYLDDKSRLRWTRVRRSKFKAQFYDEVVFPERAQTAATAQTDGLRVWDLERRACTAADRPLHHNVGRWRRRPCRQKPRGGPPSAFFVSCATVTLHQLCVKDRQSECVFSCSFFNCHWRRIRCHSKSWPITSWQRYRGHKDPQRAPSPWGDTLVWL